LRIVWLAATVAAMICGYADAAGENRIELALLEGSIGCEDPHDARLLEAAFRAGDRRLVSGLQVMATCRDLTRHRARIILERDGLIFASAWHSRLPDYRLGMWIPTAHVVAAAKAQGLLSSAPSENPVPTTFPLPFEQETKRLADAVGCTHGTVAPPADGLGRVYSCVPGNAQTVKLFVNEAAQTGRPSDVVLIWNDWTKNGGFGLHADANLAFRALAALGTLYAPAHKALLLDAFTGEVSRTVEAGDYRIEFTVHHGHEITERAVRVIPADP